MSSARRSMFSSPSPPTRRCRGAARAASWSWPSTPLASPGMDAVQQNCARLFASMTFSNSFNAMCRTVDLNRRMKELERIFREELVAVSKMAPKKEVEKGEPLGEPVELKPKTAESFETLDVTVGDEAAGDEMSQEEWG